MMLEKKAWDLISGGFKNTISSTRMLASEFHSCSLERRTTFVPVVSATCTRPRCFMPAPLANKTRLDAALLQQP
jgi:hypothetical protein